MKTLLRNTLLVCLLFPLVLTFVACSRSAPPAESQGASARPASQTILNSPCAFPTAMAPDPNANEHTAWQLFVAANCPTDGKLTWTTWIEQSCLMRPASCQGRNTNQHHLHGSFLELGRRKRVQMLSSAALPPCQGMTTKDTAPTPAAAQFVPTNLAKNPQFCEEVFVNPSESSFVTAPSSGNSLTTFTAQVAYTASSGEIQFPDHAVEIKADWLPSDAVTPNFNCTDKAPSGVYTEVIKDANGQEKCYALVGLHISSKLLKNWLWATFEPQNSITNPNRCNPNLYNSCNDPWGSNPPVSSGTLTAQTDDVKALMAAANLPAAFSSYRLVAAQSAFADSSGNTTQLGNSFVEFNAGVDVHHASCITCHFYTNVATSNPPNNSKMQSIALAAEAPIGTPGPLPALPSGQKWVSQDFSWMLGFMPPK